MHVAAAFSRSRRAYGSLRLREELREQGLRIGRRRPARIMREFGLFARRKKGFRRPVAGSGGDRAAPKLLARPFAAQAPDQAWVTDVKFVRTSEGWLYPAPMLASSRGAWWAARCRTRTVVRPHWPRWRARCALGARRAGS